MVPLKSNIHFVIFIIFACILSFGRTSPAKVDPAIQSSDAGSLDPHGPEADTENCRKAMRIYCDLNVNLTGFPSILDCVKSVIAYFVLQPEPTDQIHVHNLVPDGVINDYFHTFTKNNRSITILSKKILSPNEFCDNEKQIIDKTKCKQVLEVFGVSSESAVNHAINKTFVGAWHDEKKSAQTSDAGSSKPAKFSMTNTEPLSEKDNGRLYMVYLYENIKLDSRTKTIENPENYCRRICYSIRTEALSWTQYTPK